MINVLCDYSDCIERASIDEAYIDFTNVIEERMTTLAGGKFTPQMLTSTWIVGCDKTESEDKQGKLPGLSFYPLSIPIYIEWIKLIQVLNLLACNFNNI